MLVILAILVAAGMLTWFILEGRRRGRQHDFAAASEAKAKTLQAIAQADISGYEVNLQPIMRLQRHEGHQIDGRDLAEIGEAYLQEVHSQAVTAFPRFVAELEKGQDQWKFWAVVRLSQRLDPEARKRWERESLPLYDRYAPDSAKQQRDHVRRMEKQERQARRRALQDSAVLADSYTYSVGPADEAMSLNDDHREDLGELLLDHLSTRLAPVCLLPRQQQATEGGKGHIRVVIAGGYAIYERTPSPIVLPMRTNSVPEEFLIEITFKRPGTEPVVRRIHVKKEAPRTTAALTTVWMRSSYFEALLADVEQQVMDLALP